jgi:hypothetical protein
LSRYGGSHGHPTGKLWEIYTDSINFLVARSAITVSCIKMVLEKQIVLRAKRLMRVRKVKCFRSIICVLRFPIVWTAGFKMTVIGSPSSGAILTDAKGFKECLQFEKYLIFVVRQHISQDFTRLMIDRVPLTNAADFYVGHNSTFHPLVLLSLPTEKGVRPFVPVLTGPVPLD